MAGKLSEAFTYINVIDLFKFKLLNGVVPSKGNTLKSKHLTVIYIISILVNNNFVNSIFRY